MKIAVIGAGAIGGLLGSRMSLSGQDVTFVVRRPTYSDAINRNGFKLITPDGEELIAHNVHATTDIGEPGAQDLVILAVKAHQIASVAPGLGKLYHKNTMVMTVQNGIPWWYFYKYGGPLDGRRLQSTDPDGVIGANIDADRIIGCVVFPAAIVIEPGVVQHEEGDRFSVGEIDGRRSARLQEIYSLIIAAGLKSFMLDDIRSEIWLKAWGNLSFNPISALTHEGMAGIAQFAPTRALSVSMMEEARDVAKKLGITFRHTIERRIAGAESVGPHKTSMLQDVEAGHSLEVEALVGSIIELARLTETATPHIDAVYACTKLLDKVISNNNSAIVLKKIH